MIEPCHRPLRVLVVDDDKGVLECAVLMFQRDGFVTLEADNGETALQILLRGEADAAIVDVIMPKKSGLDVLKEFRPKEKGVPIIIFTGDPDTELVKEALAAGAADVLLKPNDIGKLVKAIRNCFELHRPSWREEDNGASKIARPETGQECNFG